MRGRRARDAAPSWWLQTLGLPPVRRSRRQHGWLAFVCHHGKRLVKGAGVLSSASSVLLLLIPVDADRALLPTCLFYLNTPVCWALRSLLL